MSSSPKHVRNTPERVVVGVSGGVDSSVAALLLKQAGYDVHGVFMFNWAEDEEGYCSAAEDFQDARKVCAQLQVTLHKVDFSAQYRERVFDHFLEEYAAGRTPNPDVLCNREIKFGVFLDYARRLGATKIATGHYARVLRHDHKYQLAKGVDTSKDQSYFLNALDQDMLAQSLFPLGNLTKHRVREIARTEGFGNARKKDSTGICFVGERRMTEFLARYMPATPGSIESPDGTPLGEHQGLMFYTLGQRQGLKIGGVRGAPDAPWYVVEKKLDTNVLVVAQGHDHPLLLSSALTTTAVHWIAGQAPAATFSCQAKTRYRQADQDCEVRVTADGGAVVRFERPQRAVTPGQFVVFYDGDVCLGGAVIASGIPLAATPAAAIAPVC